MPLRLLAFCVDITKAILDSAAMNATRTLWMPLLLALVTAPQTASAACTVVAGNLYTLVAAANADPDPSCIDLGGQSISLDQGALLIDSDVSIRGGGVIDAKTHSRVFDITAKGHLQLQDTSVQNGRPSVVDADVDKGACLLVRAGGAATLNNTTLTSCRFKGVPGEGGAIYNAGTTIVSHSHISLNFAFEGGGIFNASGADLTVSSTTFFSNRAKGTGKAGVFVELERFGGGAAIANHGSARVEASGFDLNRARLGQGGGAFLNYGQLIVLNSTFSHNRARNGAGGFLRNHGTTRLAFVTAGPNQGRYFSGNISNGDGGTVYATHTAVFFDRTSGRGTANCGGPAPIAQGYNFENDSDQPCGFELHGEDPKLATYRNYGGATATRPPLTDSPLKDGGSPTPCQFESAPGMTETVAVDQRGLLRPLASCDIGAVEVQAGEAF